MSVIMGSARNGENGTTGNKAGDQSGSEVSTQTFYVHSKGWYGFIPKDNAVAEKLAQAMQDACDNNCIGYDQGDRSTLLTQYKQYGSIKAIKTNCECDCSSLVRVCIYQATGTLLSDFDTSGEPSVLAASGFFKDKISVTSASQCTLGMVLVTKTKGHTGIIVSGASLGGSSSGTTTGSGTTSSTGSGTSGTTSSSSKLSVDGQIGKKTVTKLQQVMGQTGSNVDGFIDGQPSASKKYWTSILTEACKWTGGTSAVVKKLQQYVKDAGYSPGSVDGKLGTNTAKAVQKYLIAKGHSCGSSGADGYFGTNSAKALQNWLNTK